MCVENAVTARIIFGVDDDALFVCVRYFDYCAETVGKEKSCEDEVKTKRDENTKTRCVFCSEKSIKMLFFRG
jgi:hypothetical protein